MTIQLEKLTDFLSDLRRDTERMNHIKHYPHLGRLYDYANLALDLSVISHNLLDSVDAFGEVGTGNLSALKNLLNR
jgi:hypothetical protein